MSYFDEWSKGSIKSPYKTIDELKAAYLKGEVSPDGAWEFLCRCFGYMPGDAWGLVNLWI